jgi:2-keto-4-pentenoate hydratase/2-oxohepta-3-ene-1,7-dioic acid hydratase in catechol pathway
MSDLSKMIWNVAEQIAKLSTYNQLFAKDIIYSGHAGKRRTGGAGRRDDRPHRRPPRHQREGRLSAVDCNAATANH